MALSPPFAPMLARLVRSMPRSEGMAFEPKWDGYRVIVFARPEGAYLQSRNGRDLGPAFPEITEAAHQLGETVVLDGELVVPHAGGLDFTALQSRLRRHGRQAAAAAAAQPAHVILFDVLQLGDRELLALSYMERRAALVDLFVRRDLSAPWALSPSTADPHEARKWLGPEWAGAGVEGVVIKTQTGPYRPGVRGWYKLRTRQTTEAVIGAVTGTVSRPDIVLLGRYDEGGKLLLVARSTPLDRPLQRELSGLLVPASSDHPWWNARFSAAWGAHEVLDHRCVQPESVAEIEADTAVDRGRFRHSVRLLRIRAEMEPRQVPKFGEHGEPTG